jgi:hypothetical protein
VLSLNAQFLRGLEMAGEEFIKNSPELSAPQIVSASFDESGKLADHEVVAFGGCVGTFEQGQLLQAKWHKILTQAGVPSTSMKDAVHFKGHFKNWKSASAGVEKRDHFLLSLATAITETGLLILAFSDDSD